MGQEIDGARFSDQDFREFARRLDEETELLAEWFRAGRFADTHPVGGLELEAWLVDDEMRPAPVNEAFLRRLDEPLVVPELARFNVEINTTPHALHGSGLARMHAELERTRAACNRVAAELGAEMVSIGILPTLRDTELCLANMSPLRRYRALNEQVLRLRRGRPLTLDIEGREHLRARHHDVMPEAAATSLQIHLQVRPALAVRYYNAAKVVAAPMVAVGANAPYLYGHELWEETRIPLFEQAVAVGGGGEPERVTFGRGYARASMMECFEDNRARYGILLPRVVDEPLERLAHLRLHNGTIWRWNRPLIGLDDTAAPHLRIEHRVVSAPTSTADTVANVALFFGLVQALAAEPTAPEDRLHYRHAKQNFYTAARYGLGARVRWLEGRTGPIDGLLLNVLLPRAREGLRDLGIAREDIDIYLGIIAARLRTGQNGAVWQRAYVARHGPDMGALTQAYVERQRSGLPVHEWTT